MNWAGELTVFSCGGTLSPAKNTTAPRLRIAEGQRGWLGAVKGAGGWQLAQNQNGHEVV
jgi:hypothetical protein